MIDIEHFPVFDAHTHFSHAYLDQVLQSYEQCGVKGGIVIWPRSHHGLDYAEFLAVMRERKLTNWVPFYWPDWPEFGWRPEAFVKKLCADMRRYAAMGCRGLKVWKDLGMYIIHPDGKPATMDDPRLRPVWDTVAGLGWWISAHQADPTCVWKTRTGLRRDEIYQRRDAVIAAYPQIRFILCHTGNDIESVAKFAAIFDRFPNVWSDCGRDFLKHDSLADTQAFLEKYADRLMFGPDTGMPDHRPPDFKWEWEECYLPWRLRLVSWGMSDATFRKFTWENGERLFLK
ncbi:MAG: amidohydrolase family protein [Phycisphaerae bacterium]